MTLARKTIFTALGAVTILLKRGTRLVLYTALVVVFTLSILAVAGGSQTVSAQGTGREQIEINASSQAENQSGDSLTDQIMIKYKPQSAQAGRIDPAGVNQMEQLSKAAGVGLTYVRAMSEGAHVLRLPSRMPLTAVLKITERLKRMAEIEDAEPDAMMRPTLEPNDPYYAAYEWNLKPVGPSGYGIDAPAAWNITQGSPNVVVAVLDTGITEHPEFIGRTVPGYDFISDIWTANDGSGRDSDPSDPGDWVNANDCSLGSSAKYSTWHGTHTAGIIGATGNNGVGVAGINWVSKILPVRVLGKCGGYVSDIIDGMRWAAGLSVPGVPANANPARVINASLGGQVACDFLMQGAINEIIAKGTTVVVSAGNSDADANTFAPGSCIGVITVAATDVSGKKASYSNYGASVEISAPGGDISGYIYSTLNSGQTTPGTPSYGGMVGTSMAAPHVSGVASLLYSIHPTYTPAQILEIVQRSSTAFPAGSTCNTSICGSGIVNAYAALVRPLISSLSPSHAAAGSQNVVLSVNGFNFPLTSVVQWNGADLPTTFVSENQLTATIPDSDVIALGSAIVTVSSPSLPAFVSNEMPLYITTFEDVVPPSWYFSYVEGFYAQDITTGCAVSPLRYCPDNSVTRAQMAVFLLKAERGSDFVPPLASGTLFSDVPVSYWAGAWIEQLAAEDITSGCSAGMYCPQNPVTRAQMAVVILKAKYGSAYVPPPATGVFSDVPVDHWAAAWIEQLAAEGITTGCSAGMYCPQNPVTRAQMAVFIDKAFGFALLP